jgi:hypothetical protein
MMGLFGKDRERREGREIAAELEATSSPPPIKTFEGELEDLLEKYGWPGLSNTPAFILTYYLKDQLLAYNNVQQRRKEWFTAREEKRLSNFAPLD